MVGQQQRLKEGSIGPDESIAQADTTLPATQPQQTPTSGSPKTRLAMLKRSSTKAKAVSNNDPFRFQGDGVDFKGKLIGVRDVNGARGDSMCAEAMRLAKAAVKSAGHHKQRIVLNISIDGLKIKDEKSLTTLHNFPVSRISFIARDTTDARAFGFIYGCADNKYKFYGIKTAQTADRAVLSIRDMFQIVFEMKKAHLAEVKQKQENQQNEELSNGEGVRMDDGVAVADLLDLESELQNIEQGVNQLQNIPAFDEDSWPNADSFTTQSQSIMMPNGFTNGTTQSFNSAPLLSALGQNNFATSPIAHFSVSPTAQFSTSPAAKFSTSPAAKFGPPPVIPPHPLMGMSQPQTISADPFGDSFNPRAPPQIPVAPPVALPTIQIPPVMPLQSASNQWPHINTVHSAPNFQSSTFSETNPFACSTQQQTSNAGSDPFDTQNAQRLIQNLNNSPAHNQTQSTINWPTNENSAPFAIFNDSRSNQVMEPRKVTSLEEAITKLVDMDALVGAPEVKKNPFDGLINPPKVSLSAMSAHPPLIPARGTVPLVNPGASSDPFNDDFFN